MTVHQTPEFYIHITEECVLNNQEKAEEARTVTENEGYDFLLSEDLIIETFNSESEALQFEEQILIILRS